VTTGVHPINRIALLSSLPALLAASWLYYPYAFDGPTLCLVKLAAGTPCLVCGMTRAFACMAHGELAAAFRYHFLAPAVLLYIVLWYATEVVDAVRRRPPGSGPKWLSACASGLLFLLIFFYAARMTAFFASPEGPRSVWTKNFIARLVNRDLGNTYEVSP
jgi:hypothetical protein